MNPVLAPGWGLDGFSLRSSPYQDEVKVVSRLPNQTRGSEQKVNGFNTVQHSAIDADRRTGLDAKIAAGCLKLSTGETGAKTPNLPRVDGVVDARDACGIDPIADKVSLNPFRIGKPPVSAFKDSAFVPFGEPGAVRLLVLAVAPEGEPLSPKSRKKQQQVVPDVSIRLLDDNEIGARDLPRHRLVENTMTEKPVSRNLDAVLSRKFCIVLLGEFARWRIAVGHAQIDAIVCQHRMKLLKQRQAVLLHLIQRDKDGLSFFHFACFVIVIQSVRNRLQPP